MDPALRAFAVTNLDKDATSGQWDWRINIDAIQRSMGDLAQFDSRRSNPGGGEGGLERFPTTGGVEIEDLSPYTGDVSVFNANALNMLPRVFRVMDVGGKKRSLYCTNIIRVHVIVYSRTFDIMTAFVFPRAAHSLRPCLSLGETLGTYGRSTWRRYGICFRRSS